MGISNETILILENHISNLKAKREAQAKDHLEIYFLEQWPATTKLQD